MIFFFLFSVKETEAEYFVESVSRITKVKEDGLIFFSSTISQGLKKHAGIKARKMKVTDSLTQRQKEAGNV